MKLCKDCYHESNRTCLRPTKAFDYVSGAFIKPRSNSCSLERECPAILAGMLGFCGTKARFWKEETLEGTGEKGNS